MDSPNPVYFCNQLIELAIHRQASDIHVHPRENHVHIGYRIDGNLITAEPIPSADYAAILNRLKVLFNIGAAAYSEPQDGRMQFLSGDTKRDLRISILPSLFGESVVIRLLSPKSSIPRLSQIGMNEDMVQATRRLLESKEGLVLCTGPTGSGKTTTLYAMLTELFSVHPEYHITSIEDPIEYQFPEFTQIQVNESIGLTFPKVLRAMLRHDPDVILIGEIRDEETAEIAVRAALTGHLVFTTLHTNNAESSLHRFSEFGINPLLLADSLKAIYNQRLVKAENGRHGEFELLLVDDAWRKKIKER